MWKRRKEGAQDVLAEKKRWYKLIVHLLTRAFHVSTLKWYEMVASVVLGAFLGVGIGIVVASMFIRPPPRILVIPINQTHIVRVTLP